jgi:hypothetical protein
MASERVHLPVCDDTAAMLPVMQARWVSELLAGDALPREPGATCDDCAMLPPPGETPTGGHWFNPGTRCCTYLPELANFLVGGALEDVEHPDGISSVRARMAEGVAVTPMGLLQGEDFRSRYDGSAETFGRSESLLCPHYDDGRCTVWRHREATCATWFCKHTRGAVHKAFWNRLHQLLRTAERDLARHCAVELGVPVEGLAMMHPMYAMDGTLRTHDVVPTDRPTDPSLYGRLWGQWAGREEAYYRACYRIVEPLSWAEVMAASGSELRALAPVVRHALGVTRDESMPARVLLGGLNVVSLSAAHVRVQGYSFLDPLDLPRKLFDVLHHFDGRPLADAIATASAAAGEPVPEGAVRMLIDFGVLRAV